MSSFSAGGIDWCQLSCHWIKGWKQIVGLQRNLPSLYIKTSITSFPLFCLLLLASVPGTKKAACLWGKKGGTDSCGLPGFRDTCDNPEIGSIKRIMDITPIGRRQIWMWCVQPICKRHVLLLALEKKLPLNRKNPWAEPGSHSVWQHDNSGKSYMEGVKERRVCTQTICCICVSAC